MAPRKPDPINPPMLHIFHQWGKWEDAPMSRGGHFVQVRRCTICYKLQTRMT